MTDPLGPHLGLTLPQEEQFADMYRRLKGTQNLDLALVIGLKCQVEELSALVRSEVAKSKQYFEHMESMERQYEKAESRVAALEAELKEVSEMWERASKAAYYHSQHRESLERLWAQAAKDVGHIEGKDFPGVDELIRLAVSERDRWQEEFQKETSARSKAEGANKKLREALELAYIQEGQDGTWLHLPLWTKVAETEITRKAFRDFETKRQAAFKETE